MDIIDFAYLATSAIAAAAGLSCRNRGDENWWLVLGIGVLGLGLLRSAQAGLWLDQHLEREVHAMGWYAYRRPLQVTCIVAFALGLLIILAQLAKGRTRASVAFAICAFYALAVFAAIRLSSLHWTDALLSRQAGSVTLSHATQLVLLVTISAAALFYFFTRLSNSQRVTLRRTMMRR